ncbi:hypothetical protein NEOLEDRAFT_1067469, partial [Neolentinus lepideus HHB14362 ss-1]
VYHRMLLRGWRRSGIYCYKPDSRRSCCPQYPIKDVLDALDFKPTRSQRKVMYRWNRFIAHGNATNLSTDTSIPSEGKQENTSSTLLASTLHSVEHRTTSERMAHKFEVFLESPSYTAEKYRLYETYQTQVHQDTLNLPYLFYRFLVESPLINTTIPYTSTAPPAHLPRQYGSYHQLYRLDGRLIGLSVLDVLPGSVSSVYFMYDRRWAKYSLGKLSIMREAALVQEMNCAGLPEMKHLHLGLYVHSNPKMRYKGDYYPTYLADPEELDWHALEDCLPLLNRYRYACFAHPEHSLDGPDDPGERESKSIFLVGPTNDERGRAGNCATGGRSRRYTVRKAQRRRGGGDATQSMCLHPFIKTRILTYTICALESSDAWADTMYLRPAILATVESLGVDLAKEMVFH